MFDRSDYLKEYTREYKHYMLVLSFIYPQIIRDTRSHFKIRVLQTIKALDQHFKVGFSAQYDILSAKVSQGKLKKIENFQFFESYFAEKCCRVRWILKAPPLNPPA